VHYCLIREASATSANLIPRTFHFVNPNKIELARAKALHPHWNIRIWNDDTKLAGRLNSYLPRCKTQVQRANLIGLEAIFKEGGVYLDCGMEILRQIDPLVQCVSFFTATRDGYTVSTGAFGASPSHPAIRAIIEFLEENEPDWELSPDVTTGPALFARILRWRSDICVYPRDAVFPSVNPYSDGSLAYFRSKLFPNEETNRNGSSPLTAKIRSGQIRECFAHVARGAARPIVKAARRALAPSEAPRPRPSYQVCEKIVVTTIHGHQLVANGADYSITPRLVRDGCIEYASERFVSKVLQPGDWFIDVGANIGVFSLIGASRCGPFGRIFAFEPNPVMAKLLRESAALNWVHDRVSVCQVAISGSVGKKKLHVIENRAGDSRLAAEAIDGGYDSQGAFAKSREYLAEQYAIEVECNTLDNLFSIDVPIKLMKIDAEGHEAEVLAGAERLLKAKAFDHIMVEAATETGLKQWKNTANSLRNLLSLGYHVCTTDGNGNLTPQKSIGLAIENASEGNIVFTARQP